MPKRAAWTLLFALLAPLDSGEEAAVVRLLSPPGSELAGRTEIEVLAIDPEIRQLVFSVDGEEAARRDRLPWTAKLKLASPAREQTVEVVAYDRDRRELGRDQIVVNKKPIPFRTRFTAVAADPAGGAADVEAEVSLPRGAELERLELYWNDQLAETSTETRVRTRLEAQGPAGAGDFVRVLAVLTDGRTAEDVELVAAPGLSEEVDVNLVQLQIVVTQKNGAPVPDLGQDDFEVFQGQEQKAVASFRVAADVPLVVGLVLDSSGSMLPIWRSTVDVSKRFLAATVREGDRAFLVDFDAQLRLAHVLTGDLAALGETLDAIRPEGNTALFDSMAFSLLQFQDEPGRRALVVMTDGYDSGSTAGESTVVEMAGKLGVPIYVVALESRRADEQFGAMSPVPGLKLITDPTGGRLLRSSGGGIGRAFAQINAELRHQYVLGYYTEVLPGEKGEKVTVRVKGRKDVEVRAVFAWDQLS